MNTLEHIKYLTPEVPEQVEPEKPDPEAGKVSFQPFEELERCVRSALETYSNVHRGTGHNSMISSALFERARDIVMEYLGLDKKKYLVVFVLFMARNYLRNNFNSKITIWYRVVISAYRWD